jgi:ubiquitin carboxyl-terminal hydrolase 8
MDKLHVCRFESINGITCYINSILHILQQIPIFSEYIYNYDYEYILINKIKKTNKSVKEFVIYQLYRLIKTSLDNDNKIITPTSFKQIIGTKNDMWNDLQHQDSQEFLTFLISQIKEEIGIKNNYIIFPINQTTQIDKALYNIIATKEITIHQQSEYSPLTEMFDGIYENQCSCLYCKTKNIKYEPFITVQLDIKNNNNIYECFDELCKTNQLDCDNKLNCNFCGIQNRAYKKTLFWKTPKILIIHFKRFDDFLQKITNDISYPIKNLDISKYINPDSPYKSKYKYDLIGINLHLSLCSDNSLTMGHYISFVKNIINNKWYVYNDSNQPIQINKLNDLQNENAYLLFYYRHN